MSDKFKKLENWFDFMNSQFEKIEEITNSGKINSMLIGNDIETID